MKSQLAPRVLIACLLAPAAVTGLIAACSTGNITGRTIGSNADLQAIVTFGDPDPSFTDASVQICGSRTQPDTKYLCSSSLGSPDASAGSDAGWPCFNFTDAGLVGLDGGPAFFEDLCSSLDLAADAGAQWTFTYAVFASPDCAGALLNDGGPGFACFDSHDVVAQAHANESVESLGPGLNSNNVICVSTSTCSAPPTFLDAGALNAITTCTGGVNVDAGVILPVPVATAMSSCVITLTGVIISKAGMMLSIPVDVDSGAVALPGISDNYMVQWTASTGVLPSAVLTQTFSYRPAIEAAGTYNVSSASVDNVSSVGMGQVFNRGSTTGTPSTSVGNTGAASGSITSIPTVVLNAGATVTGRVITNASSITNNIGFPASSITVNAGITLPVLPTLPAASGPAGGDITGNISGTQMFLPGQYGTFNPNTGSTVTLMAGDYFFTSFTMSNNVTIALTPTTRIIVTGTSPSLSINGIPTFTGALPFIGYTGTSGLSLNSPNVFNGTFVLTNPSSSFSISSTTFTGSLYAPSITVSNPGAHLVCNPSAPSLLP